MRKSLILSMAMSSCFYFTPGMVNADNEFGQPEISQFCKEPDRAQPEKGMHFNGRQADAKILGLPPGKYETVRGGRIEIFENNHYLVQLPSERNGIYGTDGDDLLARGGTVGGCSLEQLSEAIENNKLELAATP